MSDRIELQSILETILGSRNVYFQPPPAVQMKYPAIEYHLDDIFKVNADNSLYYMMNCYIVTLISKDPENSVVKDLLKLPMMSYDRHYVADNLNHDVFKIYY